MKNRLLLLCTMAFFAVQACVAATMADVASYKDKLSSYMTASDFRDAENAIAKLLKKGGIRDPKVATELRLLAQQCAAGAAMVDAADEAKARAAAEAAKIAEVTAAEAKAKQEAADVAKAAEDAAKLAASMYLAKQVAKLAAALGLAPQLPNDGAITAVSTEEQLQDLAIREVNKKPDYPTEAAVEAAYDKELAKLVGIFASKKTSGGGLKKWKAEHATLAMQKKVAMAVLSKAAGDLEDGGKDNQAKIDAAIAEMLVDAEYGAVRDALTRFDLGAVFDADNAKGRDIVAFITNNKKGPKTDRLDWVAIAAKPKAKAILAAAAMVWRVKQEITAGRFPLRDKIEATYVKMLPVVTQLCTKSGSKFGTIDETTDGAGLAAIAAAKAKNKLKTEEARRAMLLKRAQAERAKKVAEKAAADATAAQVLAEGKVAAAEAAERAALAAKTIADADLGNANAQLALKTAEVAAAKAAQEAAERERDAEKADAAAAKAAAVSAAADKAAAEADTSAAKADLVAAHGELATAKSEKADADKAREEAQAALKKIQEGGGDAAALLAAQAALATAEAAVVEAGRNLVEEQAQLAAAKAQLTAAQEAARDAETAVEAAREEAKDVGARLEKKRTKKREHKAASKKAEGERDAATASKAVVEVDLARVRGELVAAEATIAAKDAEIARLGSGSDAAALQAAKDALAVAERARDEAVAASQAKEVALAAERNAVASAKQAEADAEAEVTKLEGDLSAANAAKEAAEKALGDAKTEEKAAVADQLWAAAYADATAFPDTTPKPTVDAMARTLGGMLKAAKAELDRIPADRGANKDTVKAIRVALKITK